MSNDKTNNSRRDFLLKSMTLIPAAVIGGSGVSALTAPTPVLAASDAPKQAEYQPTFFTPEEWAFVQAAVARLIPADERGPGALEAGVPEFIESADEYALCHRFNLVHARAVQSRCCTGNGLSTAVGAETDL